MKTQVVIIGMFTALLTFTACNSQNKKKTSTGEMKNEIDSVSYALGVNIGNQMKSQGFENLNGDMLAQAVTDVFSEKGETKIEATAAGTIINEYMTGLKDKALKENTKKGEEFLAKNAKRKEVVTTASGLQYEVINEGSGVLPTPTDKVKVHYHGTLIDGTVFDSSVDRGQPAEFGVTQVIPGWVEGLQLMKVGAKYKFFIPSNLAYGERGAGANIGPNSALVFEVELLEIVAAQ